MKKFSVTVALVLPAFLVAAHVVASDQTQKLQMRYKQSGYQFGWSGGMANDENANKVSFYKVTKVTVMGDSVELHYDWEHGKLMGKLTGQTYRGTWEQSNSTGKFELVFDPDFKAAKG